MYSSSGGGGGGRYCFSSGCCSGCRDECSLVVSLPCLRVLGRLFELVEVDLDLRIL